MNKDLFRRLLARLTTPFWRVLSIVDPQPAPET